MKNKIVLLASAGMGKETVKLLLQQGYTVYADAGRTNKIAGLAVFLPFQETIRRNALYDIGDPLLKPTSVSKGPRTMQRKDGCHPPERTYPPTGRIYLRWRQ